jgi:hypothetical protein
VTEPRIIPREEWGARYAPGFRTAPDPAAELWLHHSVTIAPDVVAPFADDYAAVRQLEEIGQQRFGGGISYTWCLTPAGLLFEGTGPGREGAHTAGHNTRGRGLVLVGDYTDRDLTPAQMDALTWFLPEAARRGWIVLPAFTGGHRDTKGTDCPGDRAYAALAEINRRAACGAERLTLAPAPPAAGELPTLKRGMKNDARVANLQTFLRHTFPAYAGDLPSTGNYLAQTVAAVAEFQDRAGVTGEDADGTVVGPRTNPALARYGYRAVR